MANKLTIDSVRRQAEEKLLASKFPELSSLATNDEEALEYLLTREQFEKKYPSKRARQATDKAAWKAFEKPNFTNVQAIKGPEETAGDGEIVNSGGQEGEESGVQSMTEESKLRSEFEIKLDESQLQALEEIRQRRERKKGN